MTTESVRARVGHVAVLAAVGVAAWAILWGSGLTRVRYDTLWYASFTYQDAGLPREAAWARSWDLVQQLGSPELLASLPRAANGSWFDGWDDPKRARWVGIYAMRPAMPLLGALAYPVLGTDAPIAVSVLAVVLLVLAAWVVVGPLAGAGVAAVFLAIDALNPLLSTWLIFLMPDGLGLGLWLVALGGAAAYAADGRRRWAVVAAVATLALAFDRPSAVLVPAIFGASTVVAAILRGPWRRFAIATLATGMAAAAFTGWAAIAGYPSFHDFLEDLPTNHFAKVDVGHPVEEMLPYALDLVRATPGYLADHPLIAAAIALGVVGLLASRRWWSVPFLLALPGVAALALAHPVATEVERTIAPAWLSIDLGLAVLVARVAAGAWVRMRMGLRVSSDG
ncbi:MAG TPA: hypothetical protein VGJ17_09880 [Candidatus Limnocylindrales bacterium]